MTQGSATVILDLGNSETRGIVLYGKSQQTGRFLERSFTLSNRFSDVGEDYIPSSDYSDETSTIMRINAMVDGAPFVGCFANGELQLKEFNIAPLRPSATEKKYASMTTALSYELAMLYAHRAVQGIARVSSLDSLDIDWNVVVLLPAGDVAEGSEKIVELVKSVKKVDCVYPNVQIDLKVRRVSVLPEGFCAFVGTVFDKGNTVRQNMKELLQQTTLIADIGAGTTDFVIVKDNKIIQSTMHTINRGGNNVTQLVKRAIRQNHNGLVLSETDIIEGIENGFVMDGTRKIDISGYINDAQDEIARFLVSDIQSYFEETEFPARSIARLLVCGGGCISSEAAGTKALSETLVTYFKRLSPYIELIELPSRVECHTDDEGIMHREIRNISPRHLNVIGASILAEMI